jgi:hypothetical protein
MTFRDWLKFSLTEELTYEIKVKFEEKSLTDYAQFYRHDLKLRHNIAHLL